MANIQDDVRKFILEINESKNNGQTLSNLTKLEKETGKLRQENEELQKVMGHLAATGRKNSDEYKRMDAQLKQNKKTVAQNNVEMKGLRKTLDLNYLSMGDLKKRAMELRSTLGAMSKAANPKEFDRLESELKQVVAQMDKLQGKSTQTKGALSKLKGVAGGLLPAFSFALILAGIKKMIFGFAQFDDVLADAIKTTGLTRTEIKELNKELQQLDTRSSQEELLGLVRIGGKLGISGKKDLLGFAAAADKINVSLNEDLGGDIEETLRKVGKLVDIFKLKEKFGIEDAMLRVGSVINELGATSTANEGYMVEFTNRLAGFAPNANLAITDVLGLASTLDQLGQQSEVSTTVIGKLLVAIGQDIPKFAKLANMSVADFSKLLEEDTNEAMLLVLESAKSNKKGLEGMVQALEKLGIEGQRSANILGALTSNTDKLRNEQSKANAEFESGTSILAEFANKNTTVQAGLEKLGKWFKNVWLNTLIAINDNLRTTTDRFIDQVTQVQNLKKELIPLVDEYEKLQGKSELSADEQARMKELISSIAELAPYAVSGIDQYGNAIGISTEKAREFIKVKQAMLKVQNADEIKTQSKELEKINEKLEKQVALKQHLIYSARVDFEAGRRSIDHYDERIAKVQAEIDKTNELKTGTEAFLKTLKGESLLDFDEEDESTPKVGTLKTVGNKVYEWDGKDWKFVKEIGDPTPANYDTALAALDAANQERMDRLVIQYEKEGWTDQQYKAQLLVAEMAYLETKKALQEQYGEKTLSTEAALSTKRVEAQKAINDLLAESDKELFESIADDSKEVDKAASETIKMADAAIAALEKSADQEEQIMERRQQTYLQFAQMIGQSFGDLMADSEATFGDYLKNTLLMALEAFHQWFIIEKAKTIIKGISGGPLKIAVAIAKVAAMEIAYQGVKAVVSGSIGKSKGKKDGGFTDMNAREDEVVDYVHGCEFVASAPAVRNPTIRPVLDIIDMAQRNGTIAQLNLPAVLGAIGRRSGGYADPAPSASPGANPPQPSAPSISPDSINRFDRAVERLEKIELVLSVKDVADKLEKRALRDRQSKL